MPRRVTARRAANLLIASTHEWTSRTLASVLAPYGYEVHRAYNRAQALSQIQRTPPDALVLDEQLPDGDGYSFCRELIAGSWISLTTPVFLALPRAPTRRDRLASLRVGAWACLGVPLDAEELTAMLEVFVPAKLDADQAHARPEWRR